MIVLHFSSFSLGGVSDGRAPLQVGKPRGLASFRCPQNEKRRRGNPIECNALLELSRK